MEHQSFNRPEQIPKEAQEFLTVQPEPPPPPLERLQRSMAIDAVRSCGWYNYDNNKEENNL